MVGTVGSGKSSLLSAILGEMTKWNGEISVHGLAEGFALANQEAWIHSGTIRDNILFHKPYQDSFYKSVLNACALSEDLKVFVILLNVF